jgi:hypothetical protein
MNHTIKFWVVVLGTILVMLMGSRVVSAQGGGPIVLSGVLECGKPGAEPRECPMRLHYINLTAGKLYAIQMASSDFNSRLVLEDLDRNTLATDTDCYDELYGVLVFRPGVTGMYRLTVSNKQPTEGFYSVTVREMPVLMNVSTELTPNDPVAHDAFMSVHAITLTAGRRYIIDLQSDEFDTFLKVLNPKGAIVAFADECGPMRNTRVVFTPTRTETYQIVATSYNPAVIGAFRLVVCEE